MDVTGNTHRAEFCIDKLYSPDTATGRLGLVEMRAFEMPPHARMSLAQQLLVRALIAWFWRQPYSATADSLGNASARSFPAAVLRGAEFRDGACAICSGAGYPLDAAWFAPHAEFRFPVYGRVCYEGIEVELRQAIEPWYVLGEEPGGGGTARYVDSSVERLQVRVRGLVTERHAVSLQRAPLALAAHRHARRIRLRRAIPSLAASALPASYDSRAYSAGVRCRGCSGRSGRSEDARIMWRIRAGAVTIRFR